MSPTSTSASFSTSTPAVDILSRFPTEIVNCIQDKLHPSLVYHHLFVVPKTSPVQSSEEQSQRDTMTQILDEASINAQTSGKKTSVVKHAPPSLWKVWLAWAVSGNYIDTARQLLSVDDIASYVNANGSSFDELLLLTAKDRERMNMMKLLLEAGANPDVRDSTKDTPLHFAAKDNNREAIEMLVVQYQADVNLLGSAGTTPLMTAVEHGDIDMVRLYLQSPRLDLNKQSLWGQTSLHRALSKGEPEIAELLLTWQGDLEELKDTHGKTPLLLCLTKMAGLKDMAPYIPTFMALLIAKGIEPENFSQEYETVCKDVLKEYHADFWQDLIALLG